MADDPTVKPGDPNVPTGEARPVDSTSTPMEDDDAREDGAEEGTEEDEESSDKPNV